jgi:Tol biopolymer transport system component
MNVRQDFDLERRLIDWLESEPVVPEPERLLDQVLGRTARTRRRPAWLVPERWFPVQLATRWRPVPSLVPVLLLIALLVAAAIAIAVVGSRSRVPPPFGPAANGLLLYGSQGDLFVRESIDGPGRLLVGGPESDFAPLFSSDGTRFAFWRMLDGPGDRMELWVGLADGSDIHPVHEFTTLDWYRWSPDSRVLAVASETDPSRPVTLVDTVDGTVTPLDIGSQAGQPAWRPPDGDQLVVRSRDATGAWGLTLIRRDGSVVARLPLDPGFTDDRYYSENAAYYFLQPVWSPDGSMLAFHTLEPTIADADPGFRVHVVAVGPGGSVTSERILPTAAVVDDAAEASWMPDGSGVLVHEIDEGRHAVVLYPVDGRPARDLGIEHSEDEPYGLAYIVSPDGREVIAWSYELGRAWQIDLSGNQPRQIEIDVDEAASWQRLAP